MFKFDTHMHINLYENGKQLLEQIENDRSYTICVTDLPEIFSDCKKRFAWDEFKYIRLALGFHPQLAKQYHSQIDTFIKLIPQTRYIGEIGLDFSDNDKSKDIQQDIFKTIIEECDKFKNKILTVHSRKATDEVLKLMRGFRGGVILHWYSGSLNKINEAIERGYYFSVNHQMLLSEHGRKIVEAIPVNRLLVESDAPFTNGLTRSYSYSFMYNVYRYLETTKKVSTENLSGIFKENFKNLLKI